MSLQFLLVPSFTRLFYIVFIENIFIRKNKCFCLYETYTYNYDHISGLFQTEDPELIICKLLSIFADQLLFYKFNDNHYDRRFLYNIMILTSTDYHDRAFCSNDDSELKKNIIHKFVYFDTSYRLIDQNG